MFILCVFFFQAEDGIRDLVRSRGLGDVYKRQLTSICAGDHFHALFAPAFDDDGVNSREADAPVAAKSP